MESLPNGMDILGDSCVRLNLPKNGTEKLLTRNPAQSEWRENPCALEGSEAVRTLIDK